MKDSMAINFEELNGFIKNNNYKLVSIGDRTCIMEADIVETSLNPYNTAHGGFIFGLADTAAGIACRTTGRSAMTINATIDYLHYVVGSKIKAEAKCIKDGKTITSYEVYIYDDKDNLVSKSNITYFYMS